MYKYSQVHSAKKGIAGAHTCRKEYVLIHTYVHIFPTSTTVLIVYLYIYSRLARLYSHTCTYISDNHDCTQILVPD